MERSTLNKWADLLFDTGKRNNLVNFRNTKMGTAEIVAPDIGMLFSGAEHSAVFEVYDPKNDEEDDDFEFVEDMIPAESETAEESSAPSGEIKITKEQYLAMYGRKLKKGQVLVYNNSNKPLQALKNINKKGRTAIEETGVNILYLAFGFIHWTENENSEYVMKAPILLVPVSIENESALDPYHIKVTDDEIIVNPTFSYKLQNEFGFTLPTFDDDDDIETYFDKVEALVSRLKWTVARDCKLGIFSFLKINMYQDLKNNAETIIKSPNVRAMAGDDMSVIGLGTEDGDTISPVDLLELHNVVDADSSQSEAIEMAKEGKSFVLQGPPGTGKSQTITNIIAECLADGKKVLFVSEKLAALSVVYDKLKKAGLEEFCLELHSHKANKKQVIEELCHTLRAQKSGVSERAQHELEAKRKAQRQLDAYAEELHKVRPVINKTLYRLYEEVSACRKAPDTEFAIANIKSKGEEYIERAIAALERYVEYTPFIGYDYHHNSWFGFDTPDTSYEAKMQLKADLKVLADLCVALNQIALRANAKYGIKIDTLQSAYAFRSFFALASESNFIVSALLASGRVAQLLKTVSEIQPLAATVLAKRAILDEQYDADIYKIDGALFHKKLTKQFNGGFSRLFNGEYKRMMAELKLCRHNGKKPKYKAAVQHMEALVCCQATQVEFDRLASDIAPLLGVGYQGVTTDFDQLIAELQAMVAFANDGVAYASLAELSVEEFAAQQGSFAQFAKDFDEALQSSSDAEKRIFAQVDFAECDFKAIDLLALADKLRTCLQSIDQLDNWCEFVKLLKKLQNLEARGFVDYTIDRKIATDELIFAFKKTFYSQWVDAVLHDSPVLLELMRVPHDEAVRRFKEKDELNFEINKAKIRASVSAQRPSLDMVAQGSAISILLREGEKRRKQKGVRQLLSEIGELALTLKPCFLMSPLSVSTFLSPDIKFDVIIFDEASQIFPQDAIGAVYRGKQLIVVGDSKQMPPSNFFNASADMDDDSEDESITDFESILDLCSTTFPQRRLKWHYRSRFEQLISFSNKNFYDNDLVTFPSAKADMPGVGVDYHYVDGTFDRQSKTNRAEAERVVDLVFENIEKYPERSLGVVAFSISQQNLIEKLIAKRRQSDPSKEPFFKSDRPEPFFVKNLETVQGDERDTIIFSIAYAKDAQGRLLLNFGPINREGGERRLNVAVTRAKYNVQLVTSMHYSDIDLSRTQSVGARLLREYLDYAENGAIALERAISVNAFEHFDSEFEMEVCEFLRDKGYAVDTQVGCSSFKIDLALKHPHSSNYLLAIECDGATYHSSKNARDRDRLRQAILENMGWKFYRIWSTDWFRNKRVEKERLLSAVKEAIDSAPRVHTQSDEPEISFEERVEEKHFEFPKYQMVNVFNVQSQCNYDVPHIIRAVLEVESPVSEEWMLKRLVHLYDGREKVTSVVLREYEEQMRYCRNLGIIRKNDFLYLQGKEIPMLRVPTESAGALRDVKYIALEELALGLKELLKQNVSAEKMGLFRLLVQHLGFSRMGDAILSRLESALKLISSDIEINGDMLSLK